MGALARNGRTGTDPCPFPDPNGPKTCPFGSARWRWPKHLDSRAPTSEAHTYNCNKMKVARDLTIRLSEVLTFSVAFPSEKVSGRAAAGAQHRRGSCSGDWDGVRWLVWLRVAAMATMYTRTESCILAFSLNPPDRDPIQRHSPWPWPSPNPSQEYTRRLPQTPSYPIV